MRLTLFRVHVFVTGETVQPGCLALYLAHIKKVASRRRFFQPSHTACTTQMQSEHELKVQERWSEPHNKMKMNDGRNFERMANEDQITLAKMKVVCYTK